MSIYKSYDPVQLEELQSNYIITSWSFSKVAQFARNEKAFEMIYIYGYHSRDSATTNAGKAYHEALKHYFLAKKGDVILSLPELEQIAFEYINDIPANDWKIQKTTPSVEECILKANKTVTALLGNFYQEKNSYENDVKSILDVELKLKDYLTINGVDIPIPCNMVIDLVIETNDNKIVIIDHKSKNAFSTEEELSLSIGKQAITYVKGYEPYSGFNVDEVWFAENKYSKNRSGEPQINIFKVVLDDNTKKLYEALLYEPLKRMIDAISNPDYVYLINDNDNFVDRAEIYDFWAKTMIAEVEEFNVIETKKEMVAKRLKKIRDSSLNIVSPKVIKQFKENASQFIQYDLANTNMTQQEKIQHILRTFGIIVNVAHEFNGYSSNSFLLEVSAGTKISSIQGHKLDIANALNVSNVRISRDLRVYNGKSYLEVETAKKRDKDLFWDASELEGQKIPIGKDNLGQTVFWNLENHSTPHVLMCGATGSGKSVSLISTIEYAKEIKEIEKIVILDPKYEFMSYKNDKRVEVHNEIIDIENTVIELVEEMNFLVKTGSKKKILIVFDEFADAVAAARKGAELDVYEDVVVGHYKQSLEAQMLGVPAQPKMKRQKVSEIKPLEENLRILLQKGRSVGIRIISATQRASTKVITGDAKVNYPVQICFRVPKEIDSRVVIDDAGAETLAGMGDGLIKSPEYMDIVRFQAFYKNN
ncbi:MULTISPECIES: DNA translocase FtsK [Elizabethkingia]|uniref:DNA translocase FtsK n=1 Tax=Elizabethkingia TaxID=308865 RepID=UPI0021A887E0|nr:MULTISPECIES: DNA translocase FtsK [Elizabethkingia]MCT3689534.1 PD-(D/E)XK nuclease family protein [Elizabethkingia anophelis]MCT3706377.1 PD-(D/E)XK nuclease family protein [Elizabethkingia anophelis]MCT3713396.1 PD-(D/E)XK nuclease family protein [Elizabethkingia anophelis]MCT3716814.1 PD-(D/E)XK nuclease family protein [Elizabethkingia anophelis]MCT3730427.1 PD-(D/E)XK nuclease family protein [Elizabethkingia anophelis]